MMSAMGYTRNGNKRSPWLLALVGLFAVAVLSLSAYLLTTPGANVDTQFKKAPGSNQLKGSTDK